MSVGVIALASTVSPAPGDAFVDPGHFHDAHPTVLGEQESGFTSIDSATFVEMSCPDEVADPAHQNLESRVDESVDSAEPFDAQEPERAALKVFCLKPEWGPACTKRCYAERIPCVPFAVHPYKPDGGIGKLFSCNSLLLGYMCGYHHDNGDDCYWPIARKGFAWCSYSGNQ